jgi:hypothetical protein
MTKIGDPLDEDLTTAGYDKYVERKIPPQGSELEERTGYSPEEIGDFVGQGEYVVLRPTTSLRNVVQPTDAAVVPLTLKGLASQSANQLELQTSTDVVTLSATGFDSTTAFQINQEDTTSIFDVDTTNGRVGIGPNMSAPATTLDISTNSNTAGIRIRGVLEPASDTGENASDTQANIVSVWSNLVNVEVEDSVDAGSIYDDAVAEFSDFSFSGVSGTIVGIKLKIVAHTNNTGGAGASIDNIILSWDGGSNWTSAKTLGSNLTLSDVTYTVGGSTDTWGRTWSASEFSDANFKLRLSNYNPGGIGSTLIDFIAITVYHGGYAVSTTEIADIYVGSTGNLVLDLTPGNTTSQYLDIRPEDDEYGMVLRESDGTGTTALANFYVVDGTPDYLSINVTGTTVTTALNITSDNDVGIGTAAPATKLHVVGDNSGALRLEGAANDELADLYLAADGSLTVTTTSGSSSFGFIDVRSRNSTLGFLLRESDGTGTSAYANFFVVASSPNYLSINISGTTDTDAFNIDSNNNVGIGGVATLGKLEVVGNVAIGGSNNELRFYEGANYIGFEAPALTGDQIWVLPDADGAVSQLLKTDGAGNLDWDNNDSEKSWAFTSPAGSSGAFFYGGYYDFAATDNDFSGGPTWGTANSSYAAHFLVVLGAQTVDELTLRVTGTSMTDGGVRDATPDTEDIVIPNSTAVDSYFETTKKWIGQVTITVISGTAKTCNYGWCKYWDNNNTDFKTTGVEAVWLAGANDANIDIQLLHHNATGWTFNAGAEPDFPTPIASLQGDHVTEYQAVNGENGAWKRDNLSTVIDGSGSEGTLFCVITTANKAFELGSLLLRIIPQ